MRGQNLFGLPSLEALDAASSLRIWLSLQPTDMRCGFDRLALLAEQVTGRSPCSGHLFVFRNRRGDRLKILYWDRDGYVLFYKRLEEGVFKLPRHKGQGPPPHSLSLRPSELAMLLDGIDLSSVKRVKRYQRGSVVGGVVGEAAAAHG
jgi:transposase